MAEEKKIATGYIGNALRSSASDHTTTFTDEVFDTERQKYQSEVNTELESRIEAEQERAEAAEQANAQGIIYDVSAYNNGAVFESLSALLSSSDLSTLIPTSVRHGGMSIRFVQSSDNRYVQYRLMTQNFTTDITQWQGVDDEPTVGSKNLVTSGGVSTKINQITGGNFPYNLDLSEKGRYDTDGSEIEFEWYRRTGLIDISVYKSITVKVSYINASQYYAACILYKNDSLVSHYTEKEIYDNGGLITVQSSEYDAIKLCFPYNVVDTVSATVNIDGIINGIENEIDAIENNMKSLEDTVDAIDPAVLIANRPLELIYSNGYYSDDGTVVDVAWAKRTDLISLENILSITFDGTFTNFPAGFIIFYRDGVNVYRFSEGALYGDTKPYTINCQNYDAVKISFNATDIDKKKVYVKRESKLSILENRIDDLTPKYAFCPKVIGDFPFPINTDFIIYRDNVVTNNQDQEIVDYNSNDMDENKFMLRQGSTGDKLYEHDIYNADFTSYIKNVFKISYKQSNFQDIKVMLIGDSTIDTVVNGVVQTEGRIVHYLKSEYSGNLTLIGTRGEEPYKHCGIGGWSADNWANSQSYGGTTNPFYNPSTEKFDFAYALTQNSLTAPDIVIIQLGINDVTATTSPSNFDSRLEAYINSMQTIVNSIKAYSTSIIVCVNMIIPPSKNWSHYTAYPGAILTPNIAKWHNIVASNNALTRLTDVDYFLPINCVVNTDTMMLDRVHPNSTGYDAIATFLSNVLSCISLN